MNSTRARVLVSLFPSNENLLRRRLTWLESRVGWVELRLDCLPSAWDLRQLRADYPRLSWVAACRGKASMESRHARLRRAVEADFDVVDVPLEDFPLSAPLPLSARQRRILSWHQEQAGALDLAAVLAQFNVHAKATDLLKIVTWADYAEQAWPVLELYQQIPPASLLGFSQGPGGAASRLLSLRAGAPWIYSCWPGAVTAPGQWDVRQLLDGLPQQLQPQTPALGVLGNPVAHSLSPFLWQCVSRDAKSSPTLLYLPFPVQDLAQFLAGAQAHQLCGFSVTTPHKQAAYALAQREGGLLPQALGAAAKACSAANLLQFSARGWQAGNSDGMGALQVLQQAGLAPASSLLLLGAGGAARAVAVEAERRGHQVTLASRSLKEPPPAKVSRIAIKEVEPAAFDAVIQATPVGSMEQPGLLCPQRPPRAGALALDMVYHPQWTPWLEQAQQAQAIPLLGIQMLLAQMLVQFQALFPTTPPSCSAQELAQNLEQHLQDRAPIFLVGARAAGKSTLGRRLAVELDRKFVDTDALLVARSGRSIENWLAQDPQGFRQLEAVILGELVAGSATVVATGGGVVEQQKSVTLLEAARRVVWLQCSAQELFKRQQQDPRPALLEMDLAQEIRALLQRREPAYRKVADLVIFTHDSLASSVEKVTAFFGLQGILRGIR